MHAGCVVRTHHAVRLVTSSTSSPHRSLRATKPCLKQRRLHAAAAQRKHHKGYRQLRCKLREEAPSGFREAVMSTLLLTSPLGEMPPIPGKGRGDCLRHRARRSARKGRRPPILSNG